MNLTEFLLARISEDEAAMRTMLGYSYWADGQTPPTATTPMARVFHWTMTPARVLTECDAKRRIVDHCAYRSLTARQIAAEELLAAADEYECDGAIVDALASQARSRGDLASEAAYAITASDFQHIVGRLRKRAEALVQS